MISTNNDNLLSQITVRLRNPETDTVIGTGVIYYEKKLKDIVYIITAAHCLFEDGDNFGQKFQTIKIDLYNRLLDKYVPIVIDNIDDELIFKDRDNDLAVIVIKKDIISQIIETIPTVEVSIERQGHSNFVVKGFPRATQGEELDVIFPHWKQKMAEVNKFQLELTENYSDYATQGFSGSGVFLIANGTIYLYGVFTRFRGEDRGKVIYCQFISLINQILPNKYLPEIIISYMGNNGLSSNFFKNHIKKSVKNLGPRFSEELNFKLPIAKVFNDLSFDNRFKSRFFKVLDKWLLENVYDEFKDESDLKHIDDEFFDLKEKVKKWGVNTSISIEEPLNIDWLVKGIEDLNKKIDKEESKLYDLRQKEEKKIRKEKKDKEAYHYNQRPYDKEITRLNKIDTVNRELIRNLNEKVNIHLSSNPILIIDGEAGSGKSHLLGDIASEKIKNGFPTLLLLGQHFVASRTVEENIIHLLGVNGSFTELLNDLNEIGKQISSRVVILIDAINEGAGSRLWRDQIQGLISEILDKPFVGLALTIRTTYFKSIVSDELKKDKKITFLTHQGFKGNEYAALKMFCDFHKLKQPSFPILAPEFTNPLFLKIICEGVKNSTSKEFPQGFQGVRKVFDLFIEAIDKKLEKKREEYINRKIVIKVIHELAFKIFESEYNRLSLDDVFLIMDEKFPRFNYLLNDLIEEGVFIKNLWHDYKADEYIEVIYFAYERFGDFYIADELLRNFNSKEELSKSFSENADLGKLIEDDYYSNDGVLEALATLIPEKFELEIFEVFDWVFSKMIELSNKQTKPHQIYDRDYVSFKHKSSAINRFFLNSLNWRTIKSVDNDKLTEWINSDKCTIDDDELFLKFIELTAIKNHPVNSDRLHRILSGHDMARRDGFWQSHLWYFHGYDDDNNGFPIRRLIDWAWSDNITGLIDEETARLCGQTLAWVLSSPIRTLRDQTTKALVNLLEEQPNALINILKVFEDNDDLYIRERLCAVAYGCALRTSKTESIKKIAQYIYNSIFKLGKPPRHILLRDYSRNIIEYAIYRNISIDFNLKLVRPPYSSKIPELPSKNDILKYHLDSKDPDFDKEYGHTYNGIYFNVMDWDFGRKTVEPELNHFYPISFTTEKEYKSFRKKLKKDQKTLLKSFKKHYEVKEKLIRNKKYSTQTFGGEESYNDFMETLNRFETKALEIVDRTFKGKDVDYVKNIAIPYLMAKAKIKSDNYWTKLEGLPFKRWIVQRVFDLGYNMKYHGRYDKDFSRYGNSRYNDSEKIGVKYQWIALHEILAVVTDNYKIESRDENGKNYDYYNGTWQLYSRDIDPVSITKTIDEDEIQDEFEDISDGSSWWSKVDYNYWDKPNSEWSESLDDLPKTEDVIIKKDDENNEWVYLEYYPSWEEPKKFGEHKYRSKRKNLHYLIQGYLVKKEEKNNVLKYLKNKNFFGRWMPENRDSYTNIFNREKFWSQAYFDQDEGESEWVEVYDNKTHTSIGYKLMVATTAAKGSISDDKSGANFNYNIPCKALFEGLKLRYSNTDGDFVNENEEKIVTNVSTKGTLVRKKELMEYLDENNLSIIWTLLGEKIAESEDRYYHFGVPCGAFCIENGTLKGKLKMYNRDS